MREDQKDPGGGRTHMTLLSLPHELQLAVDSFLPPEARLALECTCHAAMRASSIAVLELKVTGTWSKRLGDADVRRELGIVTCRAAVRKADPNVRVKGHLAPIYQSMRTTECGQGPAFASLMTRLALGDADVTRHWGGSRFCPPPQLLTRPRFYRGHYRLAAQLPRHCIRKCRGLSFTRGTLEAESVDEPDAGFAPSIRLAQALRYLDLSRMEQLATLHCAGMARLAEVRLPGALRVADFADCAELRIVRAAGGCAGLLSADFSRCRRLEGASLGALDLGACEELLLPSCAAIGLAALEESLRRSRSMVSVDLRGLPVSAEAVDAMREAAAGSLAAVDFAFASGLCDAVLLRLMRDCPALTRCNLRGAKGVGTQAYNEAACLMLERQREQEQAAAAGAAVDVVENRRRPRNLPPRVAAPFFYLKRRRRDGPGGE